MTRYKTPRSIVAILAFSLLIAACASEQVVPYRGQPMALIIVDEREPASGEPPGTIFSGTIERDAKGVAKLVAILGGLTGCIGGLAVTFPYAGGGAEGICLIAGIAGVGVGYVVGSAIGGALGTVEASIGALRTKITDQDNDALATAFRESDPTADLAAALKQVVPDGASLTRVAGAQPAENYGHLSGQGYPFVIVLRITYFNLIYGAASPGTRVYLAVKGEAIETATNRQRLVSDWTYTGEPVDPAKLAENESALLRSRMKKGWTEIASEIAANIALIQGPVSGTPDILNFHSALLQ